MASSRILLIDVDCVARGHDPRPSQPGIYCRWTLGILCRVTVHSLPVFPLSRIFNSNGNPDQTDRLCSGYHHRSPLPRLLGVVVTLYEIRRLAKRCPSRESLLLVQFLIAVKEEITAL
jgi:hypothetical protein